MNFRSLLLLLLLLLSLLLLLLLLLMHSMYCIHATDIRREKMKNRLLFSKF